MAYFLTIREKLMEYVPRATSYLLYFLILLIPFSIRHVFKSVWNYQTGAYSDFTSLSLYISDLVLIGLVVFFILTLRKVYRDFKLSKVWVYFAGASILWLVIELFIQDRTTLPLQLYFSTRILFLIVLATIVSQIEVSREKLSWLFVILGAIQSFIAFVQFYTQKSIGLYVIGESHLSPDTLGVAKIVSHGTKMIRGYGTFPHPNLLAAFLVISTLLNLYLLTKYYLSPRGVKMSRGIYLYILLVLNTFGLFLTFSRGGILAFFAGLLVISGAFLLQKQYKRLFHVVIPVLLAIGLSIGFLAPYLYTRTTISDNATKERLFYNEIGEKMISDQPISGVGAGNSVLHMKQYSETELQPWEIQPVHNYYLISWAEWGLGAIFLLTLILYPISALFMRKLDEWDLILFATGISFLILFLFDHYFYTIWPTQLLLWILMGLILNRVARGTVNLTRANKS